jgi:DNA-binding HxlR family transcriptional regulator
MLLHKKSRFKEFMESKEKIATNILTNRIKSLTNADLIVLLDRNSTKKSRQYIATQKGISTLPIILELYMFSIKDINESVLNDQQIQIKKQIMSNSENFVNSKRIDYMAFKKDLLSKVIEHK